MEPSDLKNVVYFLPLEPDPPSSESMEETMREEMMPEETIGDVLGPVAPDRLNDLDDLE